MNVTGEIVQDTDELRKYMVSQVTHPVKWQQSIHTMVGAGIDLFSISTEEDLVTAILRMAALRKKRRR